MPKKEEILISRLNIILKKEDINRIKVGEKDGIDEVIVDLHNLGTKDAMILINNIININREECEIKLIHGYNHGIALKDMINSRFKNPRIVEKKAGVKNLGITILNCSAV